MTSWEPADIDCDEIREDDVKWDDDVLKDLESRFEDLRQYNRNLNESRDEATREEASIYVDVTRNDIEELVANEIFDKLTILLNNTRKKFGIQKGRPIEPIRKYNNFKPADDGALPTYTREQLLILVISMRE